MSCQGCHADNHRGRCHVFSKCFENVLKFAGPLKTLNLTTKLNLTMEPSWNQHLVAQKVKYTPFRCARFDVQGKQVFVA